MHVILSAILLALAILDLVLGTSFLVDPNSAASDFGLTIASTHGESTLRGDMTAFFYVTALSLAWGAWNAAFVALEKVVQGVYRGKIKRRIVPRCAITIRH